MKRAIPFVLLVLPLAACAPSSEEAGDTAPSEVVSTGQAPAESPAERSATPVNDAKVLSLEGLGALRIGQLVPKDSGWAQRGAQVDPEGPCGTVSSPDYPGVYALTENGIVRRITIGKSSDVKLAEGIGPGASEKTVRQWFGGFREEPHKYIEGGKYLTAPNASLGESALRFEIGGDGKVDLIHVGTMPQLGYVEGCA
ncbi:hypothetical protein MKP08_00920 [Erythrobacter sp. LQ02-29]|uniref:hypothetical protein n=1 Tax=Erythrobacter sp. LQ02-29 TaxID=2920384 RepID=UPI001F4D80AF|nr:hypothetical protein [Erythrobacter sp. LQ02-29]MCP9221312.1 hypothetical protein [Erythrobacter sp. LQ02-29]